MVHQSLGRSLYRSHCRYLSGLPLYIVTFCYCNAMVVTKKGNLSGPNGSYFSSNTQKEKSLPQPKGKKFHSSPKPSDCLWNPPSSLSMCAWGFCQGKKPREKYLNPSKNLNPYSPTHGLELCTYKNVDNFGICNVSENWDSGCPTQRSVTLVHHISTTSSLMNIRMMVSSNCSIFCIVVGYVVMNILKARSPLQL